MKLFIDIGNTRLKWVIAHAGVWRPEAVVHRSADLSALLDATFGNKQAPESVWVCCVAGENVRKALTQWTEARWGRSPIFVQSKAALLDIRNGYQQPETLGADRWMALLAARKLVGGALCVVDCGTAVTVDALSADGEFLGGAILPGLGLMRVALPRGTAGLSVTGGSEATCQARNTADAIAAGTLFGVCGAIERIVAEHRAVLGADAKVLLTGGDAERVQAHLKLAVSRVPDLVLRGIARVAESAVIT
jgi:type III pantothenate kinase